MLEDAPEREERLARRLRSPRRLAESPGGLAEERLVLREDKKERKEEEELEKKKEEEPREELRTTLILPGENQEPQLLPLAQAQDQEENSELKLTSISTEEIETNTST